MPKRTPPRLPSRPWINSPGLLPSTRVNCSRRQRRLAMVAEPAGSDRILYFQSFLIVLGGILFPSCVFINFFGAWFWCWSWTLLHFISWCVGACSGLFSTCCEGPSGIHKSHPIQNPIPFVVALLSHLRFWLQEKKKHTPPPLPSPHSFPPTSCDTLFSPSPADACTIPRRQPQLPGFRKSSPQGLTTIQSPCHGLLVEWFPMLEWRTNNKKRKMHHAPSLPRMTTYKCRSLPCFACVEPQHQSWHTTPRSRRLRYMIRCLDVVRPRVMHHEPDSLFGSFQRLFPSHIRVVSSESTSTYSFRETSHIRFFRDQLLFLSSPIWVHTGRLWNLICLYLALSALRQTRKLGRVLTPTW